MGSPKGLPNTYRPQAALAVTVLGLVLTIYNFGKARDRSHFESFSTWHRTLYRDVEATSVTPFAARARDRALHAALVASVRYLVPGMRDSPALTDERLAHVANIVRLIEQRAHSVDELEFDATVIQLEELVRAWNARQPRDYWDDHHPRLSLLESAERAAARQASGQGESMAWPTPNTLRAVEPSVEFRLAPRLRAEEA